MKIRILKTCTGTIHTVDMGDRAPTSPSFPSSSLRSSGGGDNGANPWNSDSRWPTFTCSSPGSCSGLGLVSVLGWWFRCSDLTYAMLHCLTEGQLYRKVFESLFLNLFIPSAKKRWSIRDKNLTVLCHNISHWISLHDLTVQDRIGGLPSPPTTDAVNTVWLSSGIMLMIPSGIGFLSAIGHE